MMIFSDDARLQAAAVLTAAKMTGSGMRTGPDGKSSVALTLEVSLQEVDAALEAREKASAPGDAVPVSPDPLRRP